MACRRGASHERSGRDREYAIAGAYAVDFYRNFYRTGRNPVEASNTDRHADLQKSRSEALFNIDHHRSEPLESEFKSPLAHYYYEGAGQRM